MRTVTLKTGQEYKITDGQFLVLSWLATIEKTSEKSDKKLWQIWGIESSLICLDTPFELIYDITINKNFAGYKNMNRIAYTIYFD